MQTPIQAFEIIRPAIPLTCVAVNIYRRPLYRHDKAGGECFETIFAFYDDPICAAAALISFEVRNEDSVWVVSFTREPGQEWTLEYTEIR